MTYLCSADCHIMEPANLWTERLPVGLRERGPSFEYTATDRLWKLGGKTFLQEPLPIEARENGDPITEDVPLRLKELEADGIWAETMVGNMGNFCLGYADTEFAMACAQVWNDYVAEAFGPYAGREVPIAYIPVGDIAAAVKEIDRVVSLGLPGIHLPLTPPSPYFLDVYDPIWAAAQANGLPISFHVGTGTFGSEDENAARASALLTGGVQTQAAKDTVITSGMSLFALPAQQLVSTLVGAGILERFPGLQVVTIECGAGWLAGLMESIDHAWTPKVGVNREKTRAMSVGQNGEMFDFGFDFKHGGWRHPLLPSDYVRRQVHVTFMDEPAAVKFREFTGIAPLMWGSDFPHPEGTWPRSRDVVEQLFAGVDPAEKAAIVGGTLAKLYDITLPDPATA